jgi:hypothetical protein
MDAWVRPTLLPTCMTRDAAGLSCNAWDLTADCIKNLVGSGSDIDSDDAPSLTNTVRCWSQPDLYLWRSKKNFRGHTCQYHAPRPGYPQRQLGVCRYPCPSPLPFRKLVQKFIKALAALTRQRGQVPGGSATRKAIDYSLGRWAALTRYLDDGDLPIGRVSDWRGKHTARGVAVVRRSRCLNPHHMSRLQSLLIEPDVQNYRIRLSRKSLRPSRSPRLLDCVGAYRGRASHRGTRRGIGDTRCLASLVVGSTIAADGLQCRYGSPDRIG